MALATYHEPLQVDKSEKVIITVELIESYPEVVNRSMLLLDIYGEDIKGTQEMEIPCKKLDPNKTLHELVLHHLNIEDKHLINSHQEEKI